MIETDHRREIERYITSLVDIESAQRSSDPNAYRITLNVGVQHFRIGGLCESRDHAEWFRRQIVQALTTAFIEAPHDE